MNILRLFVDAPIDLRRIILASSRRNLRTITSASTELIVSRWRVRMFDESTTLFGCSIWMIVECRECLSRRNGGLGSRVPWFWLILFPPVVIDSEELDEEASYVTVSCSVCRVVLGPV